MEKLEIEFIAYIVAYFIYLGIVSFLLDYHGLTWVNGLDSAVAMSGFMIFVGLFIVRVLKNGS